MLDMMPWKNKEGSMLVGFKNEFDDLFKRFFGHEFLSSHGLFKEGILIPTIDVKEGKGQVTVKAEVPGCDPKDIDVNLNGRILTIKAEKKDEKEEKDENALRVERSFGCFSRTLELPSDVDQEKIDAIYIDGVLKLTFKKSKEAEGKKIEIKPNA